jgi:hypothetical protein
VEKTSWNELSVIKKRRESGKEESRRERNL